MLDAILAPTDFSTGSRVATDYAARLAEKFAATLHLLHVGDAAVVEHDKTVPGAAADIYHRAREERARRTRMQMSEVASDIRERFPTVALELHFAQGPAHSVILDTAAANGCDMIVMGTAGLTGLSHFLIGSTAERVVRLSPVPVLTVRSDA